ncbi:MAG TPA: glycosyltransferase family 4 protein [Gaiellaceae bacterium]|nr:glycosyltransferase family 4 protein [Gaiellaceae bacterium]
MKVCLLTQFFPPETFAGANRVAAMAAALAEVSELHVVAPEPSYPDASAFVGLPPPVLPPGATLTRVRPPARRSGSWLARAASELGLAVRLARVAVHVRPDVVVASSPSMFLGPAALAAGRRRRARVVWDVRDLTWEYGKEDDVVTGAFARAAIGLVARVMWWVAARVDIVTCATDGLAVPLRERIRGGRRIEVVPNGIDAALLAALAPAPAPPSDRLRVLYAGLVGHAQQLDVLLDVARRAPQIDITVAGDGPARRRLEEAAMELPNVTFAGYVSPARLVDLYHTADVLFAQLQRSELHRITAAPSKLQEYMAAGRFIVYAGEGSAAELVERAAAGVVVPPGDAAAIVAALATVTTAERIARGESARAYAESLPSRVDEMRRLATLIGSLA